MDSIKEYFSDDIENIVLIIDLITNNSGEVVDYIISDFNPEAKKALNLSKNQLFGLKGSDFFGSTPPKFLKEIKVITEKNSFFEKEFLYGKENTVYTITSIPLNSEKRLIQIKKNSSDMIFKAAFDSNAVLMAIIGGRCYTTHYRKWS